MDLCYSISFRITFRLECKCYHFCVIQNGCPTLLCPLSSAFMRKYWSSKVVYLSVIISADFYRTRLALKIYLPAELELLLFCFTRSRIIVNEIIGLLSTDSEFLLIRCCVLFQFKRYFSRFATTTLKRDEILQLRRYRKE